MEPAKDISIDLLIEQIVALAMKIHRELGPGFLESVYSNALAHELTKAHIAFVREKRIPVHYDEIIVGDFVADMLIDEVLILELKAVDALAKAHSVQVVNYLNATRLETGLLLNFGTSSLEFRTKTREYTGKLFGRRHIVPPSIPFKNPVNPV